MRERVVEERDCFCVGSFCKVGILRERAENREALYEEPEAVVDGVWVLDSLQGRFLPATCALVSPRTEETSTTHNRGHWIFYRRTLPNRRFDLFHQDGERRVSRHVGRRGTKDGHGLLACYLVGILAVAGVGRIALRKLDSVCKRLQYITASIDANAASARGTHEKLGQSVMHDRLVVAGRASESVGMRRMGL